MTELVGILNLTPDSFSDGGQFSDPDRALACVADLLAQGATVIDIGAESTRPNATALTAEEEWERLAPVLERLSEFKNEPVTFSLDTRHPETAEKGIAQGIHWVNDVSGFSAPSMIASVSESDVRLVVMHSLTVPADPSVTLPEEIDVIAELKDWAEQRFSELEAHGIRRERLIFDPGIGFGKTAEQSIAILRDISALKSPGVPLLVGHSRKSFMKEFSEAPAQERDVETAALSCLLAREGVDYLRVHNVEMNARALRAFQLSNGHEK